MSEGPRIAIERARRVAAALVARWGMGEGCAVVGSVRRGRAEVGDLEFAAPLPPGWQNKNLDPDADPLFKAINASVSNPWRNTAAALFAPPARAATDEEQTAIGEAVRGLRPGFLALSLVARPWPGIEIPCQVYRYTPDNRGWLLIERTGPRDFGVWFLWRWKVRFGIPVADETRRASINNHLVDAGGKVVSVATEEEAFRLAGERFVPAEERDAFVMRQQVSREVLR